MNNLTKQQLENLGFRQWDETGLMLIPLSYFDKLPDTFLGRSINEDSVRFIYKTQVNLDTRGGLLAYGVMPAPMRNICLFLDDERHPVDVTWVKYPEITEFHIVRSVAEFKEKFKELQPDMVSFDHDLGVDEKGKEVPTGYAAVKEAIAELFNNDNQEIPEAVFHSKNPVGSKNMRVYWKNGVREIKELRNV